MASIRKLSSAALVAATLFAVPVLAAKTRKTSAPVERIVLEGTRTTTPLPPGTPACLFRAPSEGQRGTNLETKVACGKVLYHSEKQMTLEIRHQPGDLYLYDNYFVRPNSAKTSTVTSRKIASTPSETPYNLFKIRTAPRFSLTAGVLTSPSYLLGAASLGYSLRAPFVLSMAVSYAPGTDSDLQLRTYAITAEIDFFWGGSPFRGFYGSLGGGLHFFNLRTAKASESGSSPTAKLGAGWSWRPDTGGASLRLLAGLQYVQSPHFTKALTPSEGTHPIVNGELGFTF